VRKSQLVTEARVGDEAEDLKSSRYCANALLGAVLQTSSKPLGIILLRIFYNLLQSV